MNVAPSFSMRRFARSVNAGPSNGVSPRTGLSSLSVASDFPSATSVAGVLAGALSIDCGSVLGGSVLGGSVLGGSVLGGSVAGGSVVVASADVASVVAASLGGGDVSSDPPPHAAVMRAIAVSVATTEVR